MYLGGIMQYACRPSLSQVHDSLDCHNPCQLSATATDSGLILEVRVIIELKSTLSCFLGALLILMVHINCIITSIPTDSIIHFFLV